jgi:hypothetical protein
MLLLALVLGLFFTPFFTIQPEAVPGTGTGGGVTGPKAPPTRGRAVITLKKLQPAPVIAGAGFKSREKVRFTGITAGPVRASAGGSFVVRARSADPCGLSIRAIGSKGSRAALSFSTLLCADQ